jgi:hypothetical protein
MAVVMKILRCQRTQKLFFDGRELNFDGEENFEKFGETNGPH